MDQEIPAGWYPDPAGGEQLRWWDGQRWTEHVHATAPSKGRGPRALVATGGVLVLAVVAVAVFVALNSGGGTSVEVVGGDSPTTEIHQFGGTALPELTRDLPQEEWEQRLDGSPLDLDALDGTAYVTTGTYGTDGLESLQLSAFDLASGERQWRHDLSGNGGAVAVEAGDQSLLLRADGGGYHGESAETQLAVVNRAGEELWAESFFESPPRPQLLPGPRLLLQDYSQDNPQARILDLASGDLVRELDGVLLAREGRWSLVRTGSDQIAVVDDEGNERWSRRSDGHPTAALGDGLAYFVDNGRVLALDAGSGEPRWNVDLRADDAYHALRVPNTGVLVRGSDGIEAFGLDGERLWDRSGAGSMTLLERGSEHVLLRIQDSAHDGERSEIELYEARTGHRLEHRLLDEQAFVYNREAVTPGQPVTADAVLVRDRGALSAIAYDGMDERWRIGSQGGRVSAAAPTSGGVVIIRWDADDRAHLVAHR